MHRSTATYIIQPSDAQERSSMRPTSVINAMQEAMRPLAKAATMLPPTAFRFDPGAAITVLARYLPQIVTGGADGLKLLGSFKKARIACCARIMPSRTGPNLCMC
jgi:hypothetical protein